MQTSIQIDQRISDIEQVIRNNDIVMPSIRLKDGLLGLSLFYYYYFLYTGDRKYLDDLRKYLDETLVCLSTNMMTEFAMTDLLDLGRYMFFLNAKGLVGGKEVKTFLIPLDQTISRILKEKIEEENLDSVLGIIAFGHFYLEGSHLKNYSAQLTKIIDAIEKLAVYPDDQSAYWLFKSKEDEKVVRLGVTNGLAGILNFLANALIIESMKDRCLVLIKKGIHFLMSDKEENGVNLFSFAKKMERFSFQDLAYGDIGIGITLYKIGNLLQNDSYKEWGSETIINAAQFKDNDLSRIKDAAMLHGAAGLFVLFEKFGARMEEDKLAEASGYWLQKVMDFNHHDTPWLGYNTYYNGMSDHYQFSLAYGLSGIGISLMAHQLNSDHDYLLFFNY